jgi:hypothetical protein
MIHLHEGIEGRRNALSERTYDENTRVYNHGSFLVFTITGEEP